MSMTIGEASAVNTLLRYFLGEEPSAVRQTPAVELDQAKAAAVLLTKSAHKALHAGLRPEIVEDQFDAIGAEMRRVLQRFAKGASK